MGLLRNLKKKFNNWVDITLAELCSAYIKQLAKQTTKRPVNSLSTTYLQSPLTMGHHRTTIATSSVGTTEKIIMKDIESTPETVDDLVADIRSWSIDRLDNGDLSYEDQKALLSEFEEWIDPKDEVEIMSLEDLEEYED